MEDLGVKITCDACFNDISQIVRIKCALCKEVDLCICCFARGSEVKDHQKDHDYIVIEPLNFSVTTSDWTAYEDLMLLQALECKGLGNWGDVSRFIGTFHSPKECEAHYHEIYLRSEHFPLPDPQICPDSKEFPISGACKNESLICVCNLPSTTTTTTTNTNLLVSSEESLATSTSSNKISSSSSPSQPSNHEITGFMPKRGDFECEFENDFENIIKDMQFHESEDSSRETQLKLAILKHYCSVLERREERKRFAFSRELIEFKRMQSIERVRGKMEREILNSCKHFARFLSPQDYQSFVEGLLLESLLKERILQLQGKRKEAFRETTGLSRGGGGGFSTTASEAFGMEAGDSLANNGLSSNVAVSNASSAKRKMGIPIDLTDVEGVELLLPSEVELCSVLRLLPKIYLSIKESLLKEYARSGVLKRAVARSIVKIDVNKTGRIYDFFVAAGWVKARK